MESKIFHMITKFCNFIIFLTVNDSLSDIQTNGYNIDIWISKKIKGYVETVDK